ncbi:hypothetical protein [Thermococcus sp. 21S9]|uniref:hypothetical protein n=1 Tax=Thermococcus sp. 21S9 TaxID=1638223 RepID=UPI00143C18D1|nr:hypothetical protein [Thermococcus sp. 21S9]NJE55283.1 hypothetical protein [Thermococcus sp. 21S9]
MKPLPEFVGLNVGFLLVVLWVFKPLSQTFAVAMAVAMTAGVVGYWLYRETRAISSIRNSPFQVNLGRTRVFTDDGNIAMALKGLSRFPEKLPRFVYVGSYPLETDVRAGLLVGIVNTDAFDGDLVEALSTLERPATWWLDFTTPTGFLLRVLLPIAVLELPGWVSAVILLVAGIALGAVDSVNLNMTAV